jgi:hypothetical protein
MDIDRYLEEARDRMRTGGVHMQGVIRNRSHDPEYGYTVGLSATGLPELIAFSCCLSCVDGLLRRARQHIAEKGPLRPGSTVALAGGSPVRVVEALPPWVAAYACLAVPLLGRDPGDISMLQLVTSDRHGRWPEDPAVDARLLADQPLLDRVVAWQVPLTHDPEQDLFWEPTGDDHVPLVVPIDGGRGFEGRFEILRAEPHDATGAVRIIDVPWYADHVGYGAVVRTHDIWAVPGLPEGARGPGEVLVDGWATRAFRRREPGAMDASGCLATLVGLRDTGVHRFTTTTDTLHVATADPPVLDAALRRYVRDGLLVPTALYSQADGGHPVAGCACC